MNGLTPGDRDPRPARAGRSRLVALLFASLEAGRGFGEIGVDTLVVSRFGAGSLPYLFIGLGTVELRGRAGLRRRARAAARGSRCSTGVLDRGRRRPARRAAADGHRSPGDRAARVADGLRGRDDRGDDRLDDGRVRVRRPPGEAAVPAVHRRRHRGQLRRHAVVRARSPARSARRRSSSSRRSCSSSSGSLVVGVSRTTTVRVPPRRSDRSIVDDLRAGFDEVVRSPLMRLVAIAYVLLAILMFSVTYPFLLAASETFTFRGRSGDGPGSAVGGRDGHLVRRLDRAREPGLREVRGGRRGPAPADRVPRRVRALAGGLLDRHRGHLPVHAAGHPARPVERRLERVLQRRPDRAAGPGPRLQRRRARPARHDPVGRPASWRPARSWRATRCSGSGR